MFLLDIDNWWRLLISLVSVLIFVCKDVIVFGVNLCMLFWMVFSLLCSIVNGVCSLWEILVIKLCCICWFFFSVLVSWLKFCVSLFSLFLLVGVMWVVKLFVVSLCVLLISCFIGVSKLCVSRKVVSVVSNVVRVIIN